jgi:protein-S-isoprenylcysteine O-methyltransferase Ste14
VLATREVEQDSWSGLIVLAPLVYLLQLLVIRKEETYLEARFANT